MKKFRSIGIADAMLLVAAVAAGLGAYRAGHGIGPSLLIAWNLHAVARPEELRAWGRLLAARSAELDIPRGDAGRREKAVAEVAGMYLLVICQFPTCHAAAAARGRIEAMGYRTIVPGGRDDRPAACD